MLSGSSYYHQQALKITGGYRSAEILNPDLPKLRLKKRHRRKENPLTPCKLQLWEGEELLLFSPPEIQYAFVNFHK